MISPRRGGRGGGRQESAAHVCAGGLFRGMSRAGAAGLIPAMEGSMPFLPESLAAINAGSILLVDLDSVY